MTPKTRLVCFEKLTIGVMTGAFALMFVSDAWAAAAKLPTLAFSTTQDAVFFDGTFDLEWSATNTDGCIARGAWTGPKGTRGDERLGPIVTSSTYELTCQGNGGSVSKSVTVNVVAAPVIEFSASPASVQKGGTSLLTWKVSNASSCLASGAWTGARALSGTQSVGPLKATRNYGLTCSVESAGSKSKTITVAVAKAAMPAPTLSLSASPSSVTSNGSSQLTWSSTDATSCSASGAWSGMKAVAGNETTGPLTANASYSLTCTGSGGSVTQTATVSVQQAAVAVTLTADPVSVPSNGSSTLTWTSVAATSCNASGGWSGPQGLTGIATVGPIIRDTTYALTCSGAGSSAVSMTMVAVREARVSWRAPSTNVDGSSLTNLAGYKIYYGEEPGAYGQVIAVNDATTLQYTVPLSPGTWYFVVTALNAEGRESVPSNPPVSRTIP